MYFQHSSEIWRDFPELVPGVIFATGIINDVSVEPRLEGFTSLAGARLASATEAELPEIQAWRRTFARMGLKPTQYRCASEALLRRYRKEGALPRINPLVDLCNALSLAFAIPIAALDVAQITDGVEVRYATGQERYLTFAGEVEHPAAGEVIFADAAGQAHARRWTNRQSGASAVGEATSSVLIVAEAMHASAQDDVACLIATLADEMTALWAVTPKTVVLSPSSPRFEF
ncbi:MAG: phenylalanine--tRNA ligase beta subunit-related protein [Chloroflexota bacterium]|nr:phenylalanine--tRNA ligase beta subunit-related protein [Chloroflexota bacterium]